MAGLFDLTGQVALVTGASRGIGAVLARGLADAGATVVLAARNEAGLREAAQRLASDVGQPVHAVAFDVTVRGRRSARAGSGRGSWPATPPCW